MDQPTPDTPQEREDKATQLAKEVNQFRWEIRAYIFVLFVLFFLIR